MMTVDRVLSIASLVGVLAAAGGGYYVLEYRVDYGEKEIGEIAKRVEEVNGVLHRRITRNADAIVQQREEALKRVGEVEVKINNLDHKIDRNHAELAGKLDLLLGRPQ